MKKIIIAIIILYAFYYITSKDKSSGRESETGDGSVENPKLATQGRGRGPEKSPLTVVHNSGTTRK